MHGEHFAETITPVISMFHSAAIESSIGTFSCEALTLANPGETTGIVVQVPNQASRVLLARAMDEA